MLSAAVIEVLDDTPGGDDDFEVDTSVINVDDFLSGIKKEAGLFFIAEISEGSEQDWV